MDAIAKMATILIKIEKDVYFHHNALYHADKMKFTPVVLMEAVDQKIVPSTVRRGFVQIHYIASGDVNVMKDICVP